MNHDEVIQRFFEDPFGKPRAGSSVFFQDGVLYSYGKHFPMVVRRHDLFLFNGDKSSVTTSAHQSKALHHGQGRPQATVSFSVLMDAGLKPTDPGSFNILDVRSDDWTFGVTRGEDGSFLLGGKPWRPPSIGSWVKGAEAWHVLGAVLIDGWSDDVLPDITGQYLCGLDDTSYFVSRLSRRVRTVTQAFESLMPDVVLAARRWGIEVLRQGEWFAIPTELTDDDMASGLGISKAELRRRSTPSSLPRYDTSKWGSNRHVVRHLEVGGVTYARGMMRHWSSSRDEPTGQHRVLNLGERWHEIWRNTEELSWSSGGGAGGFD